MFGALKFVGSIGGIIAAVMILALPGIGLGAWGMYWWDNRPPHYPSIHVRLLFGCCTWTAPESLWAQLGDLLAAEAAAKRRAARIAAEQSAITARIGASDRAAVTRIRTVYRTITNEVPHVLTPAIDRAFPLSVGFVRVHDAAALGIDLSAFPDPRSRPDDAASDIASSTAAAVIAENYGDCTVDRRHLADLQAWVTQEAAANSQKGKP